MTTCFRSSIFPKCGAPSQCPCSAYSFFFKRPETDVLLVQELNEKLNNAEIQQQGQEVLAAIKNQFNQQSELAEKQFEEAKHALAEQARVEREDYMHQI